MESATAQYDTLHYRWSVVHEMLQDLKDSHEKEAWPAFSFTEVLRPSRDGRSTTRSLRVFSRSVVVVTALSTQGCDLDHRRTGSRIESLRLLKRSGAEFVVLAQAGEWAVPSRPRPILKLLDKFIQVVTTNEKERLPGIPKCLGSIPTYRQCERSSIGAFGWAAEISHVHRIGKPV